MMKNVGYDAKDTTKFKGNGLAAKSKRNMGWCEV